MLVPSRAELLLFSGHGCLLQIGITLLGNSRASCTPLTCCVPAKKGHHLSISITSASPAGLGSISSISGMGKLREGKGRRRRSRAQHSLLGCFSRCAGLKQLRSGRMLPAEMLPAEMPPARAPPLFPSQLPSLAAAQPLCCCWSFLAASSCCFAPGCGFITSLQAQAP